MDRCIEEGEDACESCTTLIGRDAVASMSMYKNADHKLIVKKHEEEIARPRKRVQEQQKEIFRLTDINLVMSQTGCSKATAVNALKEYDNDLVNASCP